MNLGRLVVSGMLALALVACGGGGGGKADGGDGSDQVPSHVLEGTWLQTLVSYRPNGDWVDTRKSTLIVRNTRVGLEFWECMEDRGRTPKELEGGVLDFSGYKIGMMQVESNNRITGNFTCSYCFDDAPTRNVEVVLTKLDSSFNPKLASLNISQPQMSSNWDCVCTETVESFSGRDEIAVKAAVYGKRYVHFEISTTNKLSQGSYDLAENSIAFLSVLHCSGPSENCGYSYRFSGDGSLVVSEGSSLEIYVNYPLVGGFVHDWVEASIVLDPY